MSATKDKIVVIDDSRPALFAIEKILSPFYEVHSFQDKDEAVKVVHEIRPSLVLLDIVMPVSGFIVISELKMDMATRDIPVILMTTPRRNDDGEDEERSFELGAADFIPKPFKPAVVLARVRSHVNLYKYFLELESITVTDALTGVYNRRGFNDMFIREWSRARREHTDLSLLMIDIDHFKNYNDHYGHQGGDNTLSLVAAALKKTLLRATDITARYGGEEFAVILPGANDKGAQVVANNLLRAVRELQIPHAYNSAASIVTISVGIASVNKNISNRESLLKIADDMLYRAKETGRDRFYQAKEADFYE